jgi:hypothetical protein
MARAEKIYRRLPGTGYAMTHRHRLYEGPDHLLLVAYSGWSENYKRFYYADIQGFTLQRTQGWIGWGVLWGAIATLFILGGATSDDVGQAILFSMGGAFGIGCVVTLLRGPSALCCIQTAVQRERLRPMDRMRRARKIIERLKPRIEAAQGALPREDLPRLLAGLRQRETDAPPVIATVAAPQ